MTGQEKVYNDFCNCVAFPKQCEKCTLKNRCDFKKYGKAEIPLNLAVNVMFLLKTMLQAETEYRIPKKVTHTATIYKCCTCPSCGNVVDRFDTLFGQKVRVLKAYCEYCGQALDWTDVENNEGENINDVTELSTLRWS